MHIAEVMRATDVVVALMGDKWLGKTDAGVRILDERDPVRVEIEATLDGLPAVAGADALFHEALGVSYRHNDVAIATAQAMTAQLMGELGYVEAGTKDLPNRYVARSGVYWKRK